MSKKKVVAIVSPLYFVSKELVRVYNYQKKRGADVHIILTDSDIPFYSSVERAAALSVALLDNDVSVFTIGANQSAPEEISGAVETELKRISHEEYNDEFDWKDIMVYLALPNKKGIGKLDIHNVVTLSDYNDVDTLADVLNGAVELDSRWETRYLPVLEKRLFTKLGDVVPSSYGTVPFFGYGEGESAYRVVVLEKEYGTNPSVGAIKVQDADSAVSCSLWTKALAKVAFNSELLGSPFIETIPKEGTHQSVVFHEIDPSDELVEAYEKSVLFANPLNNDTDLVLIPEGRLFANGTEACWVKIALDNPSELGNV